MLVEAELEGTAQPVAALVFYEAGFGTVALLYRYEGKAVSVSAPDPGYLAALVEGLRGTGGVEFLHPRLVARGLGVRAWWRPAWKAPLHFTLPALKDLSGQVFPQPPLLFVEKGERLEVYALPEDRRPSPDTPLLLAPYFNLYGHGPGGGVCLGTGRRGRDVEDWESAFFESAFSHLGGTRPLKEGSLVDLWRSLAGQEAFPLEVLREAGLTLAQAVRGGGP